MSLPRANHPLWDFLESRTGLTVIAQEVLEWTLPGGPRWRYVWGTTLAFVFFLLAVTGMFLWLAYSPSTLTAWESVYYIQHHMTLGWFIRGVHHFAAQAMMILLAIHLVQVIVHGAYRAPREVTFWLGLALIPLVMVSAQTGYLLPWDQRGLAATKVATSIAGAHPGIGPQLQQVAQGGATLGHATLTRFFALHAGLLPVLMIIVLWMHRAQVRRHRLTAPAHAVLHPVPYWPFQAVRDATACVAVLAAIVGVTIYYHGAELGGPAGLADDFAAARPEWYFLFLFRLLRFEFVKSLGGLAFGGIFVPGAVLGVFALMPLLGRYRVGHWFNVAFLTMVGIAIGGLTGLALYEDAGNTEHQAALAQAHRDAERAVVLSSGLGIPAEGASALLRSDPLTQGPRLFARHCASCHHFNGHDGTGTMVAEHAADDPHKLVPVAPTAADLGNFGSRAWMRDVLVDFHTVFAPLKNAKSPEGAEKSVGERFLTGDMATWSTDNKAALTDSTNAQSLAALVEFLVQQSARTDQAPIDEALAKTGQEIFANGALISGMLTSACTDCHTMKVIGATAALSENAGSGVPTLTGYAGSDWLRRFILEPGHADFYGDNNSMIPFAGKLSESDLTLLVNWMTGAYYRPATE